MNKTGLVYDERFLLHDAGLGHPESKERLLVSFNHLKKQPWFSELKLLKPKSADIKWVELNHSKEYIERANKASESGNPYLDCADVGICKDSFDAALLAVGGSLELARQIMEGKLQNGFALIRPPGHHAEYNEALGFCLFNNIAITAHYLKEQYDLKRILILDWDVHHGNGTQHSFEEDPSVFYISLHQYPHYPGTGSIQEIGNG